MPEKIETGVDKLLQLIDEKHKITVSEASKSLGVQPEILEQWIEVLNENNLIRIRVGLKETMLIKKGIEDVETEHNRSIRKGIINYMENRLKTILLQTEEACMKFKPIEKKLMQMSKDIDAREQALKKQARILKELSRKKDHMRREIKASQKSVAHEYEKMGKGLGMKLEKYSELETHIFSNYQDILERSLKILSSIDKPKKAAWDSQASADKIHYFSRELLGRQREASLMIEEIKRSVMQNKAMFINVDEFLSEFTGAEIQNTSEQAKLESEIIAAKKEIGTVVSDISQKRAAISESTHAIREELKNRAVTDPAAEIRELNVKISEIESEKDKLVAEINKILSECKKDSGA